MRRGIDTNVLVYAHMPAFPEHGTVRRFLVNQLQEPGLRLVVTPNVLHEFVHVITDPKRFKPLVPMAEALAVAGLYLGRTNVQCAGIDEAVLLKTFQLLERHNLGRKRIADTLFAATLLHHGITEIITCDPDDFRPFKDLAVVDQRSDPDHPVS